MVCPVIPGIMCTIGPVERFGACTPDKIGPCRQEPPRNHLGELRAACSITFATETGNQNDTRTCLVLRRAGGGQRIHKPSGRIEWTATIVHQSTRETQVNRESKGTVSSRVARDLRA